MQFSPNQRRGDDSVTEPSGQGPFAEAMRELIAALRPFPGAELPRTGYELQALRGGLTPREGRTVPARGARRVGHLQLVR